MCHDPAGFLERVLRDKSFIRNSNFGKRAFGTFMADTAPRTTLLQLAAERFQNILPAEEKLFEAAEKGSHADCREGLATDGIIRSDRLSWLCTDSDATQRVSYRGVSISGAEILGKVDLEWVVISFPLVMRS